MEAAPDFSTPDVESSPNASGPVAVADAPTEAPAKRARRIVPSLDRVLIKPVDEEKTTPGGLVIPDMAKDKPLEGKIVAVGPGAPSPYTGIIIPVTYKVGDEVLFGKYAGMELKVNNERLVMVRADEILGYAEDI